jgi:serine O-acetyltransferase
MSLQDRLLRASRLPVIGRAAYFALKALGVEFPRSVEWVGPIELAHGAVGLVLHRATRMGSHITLLPGVVIGRADAHEPLDPAAGGRVVIGDHVVVGAGAKVLFRSGEELVIGAGTVIGANSVLLTSTGEGEVWAGAPARRVGARVR